MSFFPHFSRRILFAFVCVFVALWFVVALSFASVSHVGIHVSMPYISLPSRLKARLAIGVAMARRAASPTYSAAAAHR